MSLNPSSNYIGASYLTNVKENWVAQLFNQDSYLQFDGTNDSIDLGATTSSSPLSFTSSTKMSACGWVKFPTLGSTEYIFANNSIVNWAGIVILKDSSNRLAILWGDTSGAGSTDYELMKTNGTFSADTWTFFAITTDFSLTASDTKIWLGTGTTLTAQTVSNSGTAGITTPTYTSGNAYIGRYFSTYSELDIRNLGFWTGELDSDSVTALFNSGEFLSFEEDSGNYDQSSNLKGYFEFNNGENFAQDITGNISTGTITGAKYKGFLPIAMRDTKIDDVFYHGVIKSAPSIRQSINLAKSTSKTSNMSLDLVNFKYQGSDVSAELFLGSNSYYNRTVKVYSQLNETSDIADCLQLYHGRLTDITHDDNFVKLSLVTKSPWDDKFIPDVKSPTGRFFPVVYGAYTPNSSGYGSEAYAEALGQSVFPVEVDVWGYNYKCLFHKDIGSTDTTLHYYEESLDSFLPLANSNNAEEYSEEFSSGYIVKTKFDLLRHFKFKPIDTVLRASGWDSTYQVKYAFDGAADEDSTTTPSTFAQFDFEDTVAETQSSTTVNRWRADTQFDIPAFDDLFYSSGSGSNNLTCELRWLMTDFYGIHNNDTGLDTNTFKIYDNGRYGGSASRGTAEGISNGTEFSTNGSFSDASANSSATKVNISERTASHNMLTGLNTYGYEDGFWIRFERSASRPGDASGGQNIGIHGVLKVYDVRFKTSLKVPTFNTSAEGMKRLRDVKKLYSGADGLTASWDDSAITLGHQAHRDALIRFSGMPTIEPENYSTLHGDRGSWTIRHWQNKEISLIKYLEKLQYEFGFVHIIDASGKSKYIWVHGTAANNVLQDSDITVTLNKNDIDKLSMKTTSVKDIVTKAKINTIRHPAKENYLTETTAINSSPRTKYNIKSRENTTTINLDALTLAPATTPAADKQSDFFSYYSQINADVKKIIECDVVNHGKGYILEVGDVVKFDNTTGEMHINPYADNWNDYYMVIALTRSLNKVKIKLVEIG